MVVVINRETRTVTYASIRPDDEHGWPTVFPWPGQTVPPVDKPEFESELTQMVSALGNTPSIIMWEIFNEGQGQYDTPRLVSVVKKLDPSRLINEASGGGYSGSGDV